MWLGGAPWERQLLLWAVGRLLLECGGYRLACVTLLLPERLTTNINSTGLVTYSPGSQKSKIRVN